MRTTTRRALVPLVALALLGAACTSDDNDSSDGTTAPDGTDATEETTAPEETDGTRRHRRGRAEQTSRHSTPSRRPAWSAAAPATTLPGFAMLDADGEHVGFDSDFCRVIAAAVLGDAEAVEMVDLETADRFTALQSGEVDVLVRNTTWTATRDGGEGATFVQPNFYDGQGMMVAADSGFASIADMDGVIVCVAQGTTTEGNAAAEAARLGLDWEVRPFEDTDLIQEAFVAGQCDGWSSDTSQLTGLRSTYPDGPDALTILPEVFSKEPLAPAVADGDTEWAQAVNWADPGHDPGRGVRDHLGEHRHLRRHRGHQHPAVPRSDRRRDDAAVLDPGLGLPTDFAYQVVSQVGNYGEIFERHLAPLGLERGVNALWTDGGLMYAPPYR